jgi:hypothetical protein
MKYIYNLNIEAKGWGMNEMLKTLIEELEKDGITRFIVSSANKDWKRILDFYEKHDFNMWTITLYK